MCKATATAAYSDHTRACTTYLYSGLNIFDWYCYYDATLFAEQSAMMCLRIALAAWISSARVRGRKCAKDIAGAKEEGQSYRR